MDLLSNSYFALFLIISLGFILGKIKIRGISLDVSAVLFIALLFGHYGVLVPTDFQYIGLTLFIFTIAIQSGPGFIQSFRKQGIPLFILTLILVSCALLISILCSYFLNIDKVIGIGLFAGAITSTPGLAVAIDVTGSSMASIGYGIAYPFGILGVIIFVRLFPKIMNINLSKAEKDIRDQTKAEYPEIHSKQYIVENQNIIGKPLEKLQIRTMTGASITRVLQDERAITPMPDLILNKGNLIKAVGTDENLEKVRLLVGSETDREIPLAKDFVVESVLVTNKKVVNKTVEQLNLFSAYGATIASIRRSGINIASTHRTHILFGDKLMIACSKDNMKEVVRLLGNEVKRLSDTDFFPIAAGIVLGILIGQIRIVFSDQFVFSPGLTGGVLIAGLVLSNLGKTGPIVWTMSGTANHLLRQLGLLFFLSAVGTHAGSHLVETFTQYGAVLFLAGVAITLVPMILTGIVATYFFKMNVFTFMGGLTGGMTSTAGLSAIDSMTDTNTAQLAYATVYPIALVLIIVAIQIISYFV